MLIFGLIIIFMRAGDLQGGPGLRASYRMPRIICAAYMRPKKYLPRAPSFSRSIFFFFFFSFFSLLFGKIDIHFFA